MLATVRTLVIREFDQGDSRRSDLAKSDIGDGCRDTIDRLESRRRRLTGIRRSLASSDAVRDYDYRRDGDEQIDGIVDSCGHITPCRESAGELAGGYGPST